MITTEDVIRATGGVLLNGDMKIAFTGVCQDSRRVRPGELFVALRGPRFDGHRFVSEALLRGAKGALVESWPEEVDIFELHRAISIIKVSDTYLALRDLAAYWRRKLGAVVIGITGSSGKTTTKEFLVKLLEEKGAYGNPGNWNNLIGVPLSILNAPQEARLLVLELATNQPGEIPVLARMADPDLAVLLGVKPAHLEGFSSFEAYLEEKLALISASRGAVIYPFDQEEIRTFVAKNAPSRPKKSFGFEEGADFRAKNVRITPEGTIFSLEHEGENYELRLPLLGRHFVLDFLAALAAASFLVPEWKGLLTKAEELKTLPRRCEIKQGAGFLLIDDTYNANPWSLKAGMEVACSLKEGYQRLLAVVGPMKELGQEKALWHRKAGEELAKVFDLVFVVGEYEVKTSSVDVHRLSQVLHAHD
jgi:UDP-N-acetylmuramoyl-tripeptide--D-alanyl-D-alanine ligase